MSSALRREALETPAALRRLLAADGPALAALVASLRAAPPPVVVTCARGSSAHATIYGRHLIETRLGIVAADATPSIGTLYRAAPPRLAGALFVAVSQSGSSPDLIAKTGTARAAGARTLALVNDAASPLAAACEHVLPLHAGPETSVAATKSFLAALAAQARLVAAWAGDAALAAALARLPDRLEAASRAPWDAGVEALANARAMLVIGRGLGFALAEEIALKLKETCGIHAEAFSAAEIMHGPLTLVGPDCPVLAVRLADEGAAGLDATVDELRARGGRVIMLGPGGDLPLGPSDHPASDAIALGLAFYLFVDRLAARRGRDPDRPPHLAKVTRTI